MIILKQGQLNAQYLGQPYRFDKYTIDGIEIWKNTVINLYKSYIQCCVGIC